MFNNFKVKFKDMGDMKDLFWRAVSTANVNEFNYWMGKIEEVDPKVRERQTTMEWLRAINLALWTRSHFSIRSKCDALVNNLFEYFNSYILEARDKPVITIFEWIKKKLIARLQVKRKGMEQYSGDICPAIQNKLEFFKEEPRNCFPTWCGQMNHFDRTFIVDLASVTCICMRWDLSGIPYSHAISAIHENHQQPKAHVHNYYNKTSYLQVYYHMIHPVHGMHDFIATGISPLKAPLAMKLAGRPRKLRKKVIVILMNQETHTKQQRKSLNVTCPKCLQTGHNRRSCKNITHI
ncbi:hypothetical protein CsSME_00015903 [Camellia sinensis var. sinensis]